MCLNDLYREIIIALLSSPMQKQCEICCWNTSIPLLPRSWSLTNTHLCFSYFNCHVFSYYENKFILFSHLKCYFLSISWWLFSTILWRMLLDTDYISIYFRWYYYYFFSFFLLNLQTNAHFLCGLFTFMQNSWWDHPPTQADFIVLWCRSLDTKKQKWQRHTEREWKRDKERRYGEIFRLKLLFIFSFPAFNSFIILVSFDSWTAVEFKLKPNE